MRRPFIYSDQNQKQFPFQSLTGKQQAAEEKQPVNGVEVLESLTVRRSIYISPVRMLALSFLLIIPAGAILLVLPLHPPTE